MQRDISKLSNQTFDLLVIGGGINGAAIANVASFNGLSVALIEKNDFASGTSSKSTKLLHGGLRYLENFEFDLVAESLRERYIQVKSAPHLTKVLAFVVPVYKNDPRPLWKMRLGVWLYDVLSGKYSLGRHESLSAEEVVQRIPGIKTDGLVGGVLYYDAQMDDARLCVENVLTAESRGAVVANDVEMKSFVLDAGRCVGVEAFDKISGRTLKIQAKAVVCATGVWTDDVMRGEFPDDDQHIRATKGVHVVYRRQISKDAMLLQSKNDGRIFFVIPYLGHSLIGTTDTDYHGDKDRVEAEPADIDYLMGQVRQFFPQNNFKSEDIVETFAGLRPLARAPGDPSKVSRKHVIRESSSGIITVVGGKYTTYRVIAEDVVKRILHRPLKDTSKIFPLCGGGNVSVS